MLIEQWEVINWQPSSSSWVFHGHASWNSAPEMKAFLEDKLQGLWGASPGTLQMRCCSGKVRTRDKCSPNFIPAEKLLLGPISCLLNQIAFISLIWEFSSNGEFQMIVVSSHWNLVYSFHTLSSHFPLKIVYSLGEREKHSPSKLLKTAKS